MRLIRSWLVCVSLATGLGWWEAQTRGTQPMWARADSQRVSMRLGWVRTVGLHQRAFHDVLTGCQAGVHLILMAGSALHSLERGPFVSFQCPVTIGPAFLGEFTRPHRCLELRFLVCAQAVPVPGEDRHAPVRLRRPLQCGGLPRLGPCACVPQLPPDFQWRAAGRCSWCRHSWRGRPIARRLAFPGCEHDPHRTGCGS